MATPTNSSYHTYQALMITPTNPSPLLLEGSLHFLNVAHCHSLQILHDGLRVLFELSPNQLLVWHNFSHINSFLH